MKRFWLVWLFVVFIVTSGECYANVIVFDEGFMSTGSIDQVWTPQYQNKQYISHGQGGLIINAIDTPSVANPTVAPTLGTASCSDNYRNISGVKYVTYTWVEYGGYETAKSPQATSGSISGANCLTVNVGTFPDNVAFAKIYIGSVSGSTYMNFYSHPTAGAQKVYHNENNLADLAPTVNKVGYLDAYVAEQSKDGEVEFNYGVLSGTGELSFVVRSNDSRYYVVKDNWETHIEVKFSGTNTATLTEYKRDTVGVTVTCTTCAWSDGNSHNARIVFDGTSVKFYHDSVEKINTTLTQREVGYNDRGVTGITISKGLKISVSKWKLTDYDQNYASFPEYRRDNLKVTVNSFHHLLAPETLPTSDMLLSIPYSSYVDQLQYFIDNGYSPVSMLDIYNWVTGSGDLPDRPVLIVLDDGTSDHFSIAFPYFKVKGFYSNFLIPTNFVGVGGFMTQANLTTLKNSGYASFSNHGAESTSQLWNLPNATVDTEFDTANTWLTSTLGATVYGCVPGSASYSYYAETKCRSYPNVVSLWNGSSTPPSGLWRSGKGGWRPISLSYDGIYYAPDGFNPIVNLKYYDRYAYGYENYNIDLGESLNSITNKSTLDLVTYNDYISLKGRQSYTYDGFAHPRNNIYNNLGVVSTLLAQSFTDISSNPIIGYNGATSASESTDMRNVQFINSGLSMSGSTFLTIPDSPEIELSPTGAWSFEACIRPTTVDATYRSLFGKDSTSSFYSYGIDYSTTPKIRCYIGDTGGTHHVLSSNSAPSVNTVYHVMCTSGGVGTTMKMYVNGALQTNTATQTITVANYTAPLCVGTFSAASACGTANNMVGDMDNLALWNMEITSGSNPSLSDRYNNGCKHLTGTENNLLYGLNFDNSSIKSDSLAGTVSTGIAGNQGYSFVGVGDIKDNAIIASDVASNSVGNTIEVNASILKNVNNTKALQITIHDETRLAQIVVWRNKIELFKASSGGLVSVGTVPIFLEGLHSYKFSLQGNTAKLWIDGAFIFEDATINTAHGYHYSKFISVGLNDTIAGSVTVETIIKSIKYYKGVDNIRDYSTYSSDVLTLKSQEFNKIFWDEFLEKAPSDGAAGGMINFRLRSGPVNDSSDPSWSGWFPISGNLQLSSMDSAWTTTDAVNLTVTQETTDKKEGTASNKIVASTSSLNAYIYLNKTAVDVSSRTLIPLWIKCDRTGDFLEMQISETQTIDTGQSYPIYVDGINIWQEYYLDITDIVAANKNAVNFLAFKVKDATSGFTCYIDDVRAEKYYSTHAGSDISDLQVNPFIQYQMIMTTNDRRTMPRIGKKLSILHRSMLKTNVFDSGLNKGFN